MRKLLSLGVCFCWCCCVSLGAIAAEPDATIELLKQQIEQLQKQVVALEKAQQTFNEREEQRRLTEQDKAADMVTTAAVISETTSTSPTANKPSEKVSKAPQNNVRVYATMRPTYGYFDEKGESFWDVRDALSHAGIKASNEFMPGWTAVLHGEWGIDISNNGDFGKARRAYVAVESPVGRVGIGKQRPPQYLLIAEYVDIFNHANSPFSYDAEGIFFVDNMVTYRLQTGGFNWLAAGQFDGDGGSDRADLVNLGVSYDINGFHSAITYLQQDSITANQVDGDDEVWAAVLANDFGNGLYLAAAYQDKRYNRDLVPEQRTGHTLDISGAYRLSEQFRLKLGYFDFDDGHRAFLSQGYDGYNTTLEWLPDDNLRFHIEYLTRNYDYLDDFDSWSVGFRYDFAKDWQF
ncbi:hypothetical protein TUM4644_22840 [Shewanella colwelliana]|uniref:Porin domain-containing protein n=1 Tax=Shewanella colwelliana TaxID=23 RepID=A0ABQ4P009_SHECO|nr:porin [Shewanella colwelliana]MDX1280515.1 porin [Shewanella colwelliana]GIU26604.1 hypothetical protein TUM4644_22840 [Shewanella colwelliana]GIU40762.1 hypothetical protein TUM3794_19460 [Shewanella colwelliana]